LLTTLYQNEKGKYTGAYTDILASFELITHDSPILILSPMTVVYPDTVPRKMGQGHGALNNSRKRTSIDLSVVGDRVEQLRHDSAWKALTLSKKVIVLLNEYLDFLEKQEHQALEEKLQNLRPDATWKAMPLTQKIMELVEEHLNALEEQPQPNKGKISSVHKEK
jgi:hypothetical protein